MDHQKIVSRWLLTIMIFIIIIIIVGGITRITESGLSMVDWHPVTGILPPLNEEQWQTEFGNYKKYPEYQNNSNFTIQDFKKIFWWEYIHRLIGRIIGLIALIPYLYLSLASKISKSQKIRYFIIVLLIAFQGILGWMMVKTGLNQDTYNGIGVSPYFLAMHLSLALITFCYVFWQYMRLKGAFLRNNTYTGFNYGIPIFILLFIQIILGAILSGMNGGLVSHTFPMMSSQEFYSSRSAFDFRNTFFVHFLHRWFPFLVLLFISFVYYIKRTSLSESQKSYFKILFYLIAYQIALGVLTVIFYVPGTLAILHQLGAVFIIMVATLLLYSFNNK